jgi:hypothetical protein
VLPGEKIQFEKFLASLDGDRKGGSPILMEEMQEVRACGERRFSAPSDGEDQISLAFR